MEGGNQGAVEEQRGSPRRRSPKGEPHGSGGEPRGRGQAEGEKPSRKAADPTGGRNGKSPEKASES